MAIAAVLFSRTMALSKSRPAHAGSVTRTMRSPSTEHVSGVTGSSRARQLIGSPIAIRPPHGHAGGRGCCVKRLYEPVDDARFFHRRDLASVVLPADQLGDREIDLSALHAT